MIYYINGDSSDNAFDVNGNRLEQCFDINGNPLLEYDNTLTIMSYNVGAWTAFGVNATTDNQITWYKLQNNILSNCKADLAGIQEYTSAICNYSVPKMLGFYFGQSFSVDRIAGKAGRDISSRFTISDSEEINFINQRGEIRSYLISTAHINGKEIKFLCAHLSYEVNIAELQIGELLDVVSNFEYWILTGDFNVPFQNVNSRGYQILVQAFLDAGYNVANGSSFGMFPTFTTATAGSEDISWSSIDNIMCSSNINILDVWTNTEKLEHIGFGIDHLPLLARVEIN